jgi:hypothetical protein
LGAEEVFLLFRRDDEARMRWITTPRQAFEPNKKVRKIDFRQSYIAGAIIAALLTSGFLYLIEVPTTVASG